MGVGPNDLVMVERAGVRHRTTAGAIAALGGGGGGGGGAVSYVAAQVDFGTGGDFRTVDVAAPWVTAGSTIIVTPAPPTTSDHDPEDALIELLQASVISLDPGVGFTIAVHAPEGSWGRYDFHCVGV